MSYCDIVEPEFDSYCEGSKAWVYQKIRNQAVSQYSRLYSEDYEDFDDLINYLCYDDYEMIPSCFTVGVLSIHLVKKKIDELNHKRHFKNNISEELTAKAMSPERLMKRMSEYDDIEEFFENL